MNYSIKPNDPLFREAVATPLSEDELAFYLRMAWKALYKEEINTQQLCILWCHTSLEIGRGKFIFNNNFGNIKRKEGVTYTSYKCNEIINGKTQWFEPYHPQTFFQHWDTATGGAKAYLQFLNKKRYQAALAALKEGNIIKYCAKLKEGGYFTADLNYYTNLMLKLNKSFDKKSEHFMKFVPGNYVPETAAVPDSLPPTIREPGAQKAKEPEEAVITLPSAPSKQYTPLEYTPKNEIEIKENKSFKLTFIEFIYKILSLIFKLKK